MDLPRTVAHFVIHRRRTLLLAAVLLLSLSAAIIALKGRLASDILDLLPAHFDSVQTFKVYDREFTQARQLTFAILDETKACDLDGFTEHFAQALKHEPWVLRVMHRSPIENPEGIQDLHRMTAPLLLNLPTAEFDTALSALDPAAIAARLKKLRATLESGSPKAELELEFDPLGLVTPAFKPLAGSISAEKTPPLASADGTLRLVLAVTNQTDLGAHASQSMMRQVADFQTRVTASWRTTGERPAPQILVTGRTPYVGELSLKMRSDVVSTLLSSTLLVALTFYLGFRQLRPLVAILHVLLLCCVLAVAGGVLVFHELNMITIGLCSILIGLGVDFGMLLFGVYQVQREAGLHHEQAIAQALRQQGRGILFGTLTTAAAFLCLGLTQCSGFAQLGVLIAIGICFAGLLMMTAFFAFIGSKYRPQRRDWMQAVSQRFVRSTLAAPKPWLWAGTAVLLALTIYSIAPIGRLQFEANPKSLEPRNSNAGNAMRTIMGKLPGLGEPLIVLLQAPDAETFHQHWSQLQSAWSQQIQAGKIKNAVTPAAFTLSPLRAQANAARLTVPQLDAACAAFNRAILSEGLNRQSFDSTFAMLDALRALAGGKSTRLDWPQILPPNSSWWFVLDRFFAKSPNMGLAYVFPIKTIASFPEKEALRDALSLPGMDLHISGWTYTLADLLPWAKTKLTELTLIMVGLNALILVFLYRRAFPLLLLMLSLALSVGAMMATLKAFGVCLNLFNALAFPLVLGVGVDYGIYIVLAMRNPDTVQSSLSAVVKPVLLSGLTTVSGFASLATAQNPALRGLGIVCATGVGWCLFATFFFILPAYALRRTR